MNGVLLTVLKITLNITLVISGDASDFNYLMQSMPLQDVNLKQSTAHRMVIFRFRLLVIALISGAMTCLWILRNFPMFVSFYFVSLLLYGNIHTAISLCTFPDTPFFSSHPRNATVRIGEKIDISCTVSKLNPTSDSLVWQVHPNEDYTVILPSFDNRNCSKTSTLSLFNVGRNQRTLQCVLHRLNEQFVLTTYLSQIATINVLFFPGIDEITCGPKALEPLTEDGVIFCWCQVPIGSPPVDISWQTGVGNVSPLSHILVNSDDFLTLNQTFRSCRNLHSKTFRCIVRSPEFFPNQELSCSVGPFIVLHKPTVVIQPSESRLLSNGYANSVQLDCYVESFPPNEDLYWSCHPTDRLSGCNDAKGNSILLSLADTGKTYNIGEDDIVIVTCLAMNSVGAANSTSKITIIAVSNSSEDVTTTVGDNHNDVFQEVGNSTICKETMLDLIYLSNSNMKRGKTSFLCLVHDIGSTTPTSTSLLWYINDRPVQENVDFLIREVGSFGSSSLSINSRRQTQTHTRGNISCAILVGNRTLCKKYLYDFRLDNELQSNYETIGRNTSPQTSFKGSNEFKKLSLPQTKSYDNSSSAHIVSLNKNEYQNLDDEYESSSRQLRTGESHYLLITLFGIVVSILLIVFLFAFSTVFIVRYLKKKNNSNDRNAQTHAMNIDSISASSQQNTLNNPVRREVSCDPSYEEAVKITFATPSIHSLHAEDLEHSETSCLPQEDTGSSFSSSIYESMTSSQSFDEYSCTSKRSLQSDWDDNLPSDEKTESQEMRKVSSFDNIYNNESSIRMHARLGAQSLQRLKAHRSADLLNESTFPPPPLPCSSPKAPIASPH